MKQSKWYRVFAFVVVVAMMTCLLAACGSKGEAEPEESKAPVQEKFTVGFSQTGTETEWVVAMSDEVIASFQGSELIDLQFSESQAIQENQIKALRAYIQQGVDAIILRPTVTTGWDTVLMEAKDAGIPVILAGRNAEMATGDIKDYILTYVGPDNVRAGEHMANTMLDMFADEEGPINVVVLEGTVGASAATERNTGILNVINNQDKLVIYGSQSAEWTRTKGKEVMEAFLKSAQAEGIVIRGVMAHCDDMALGAIQAIEEAGLKPGEDIYLMGVDGAHGAFEAMVEGKYNATVENPLGYGPALLEVLTAYFKDGKAPEPWVVLDNVVYTMDQAAEVLPTRKW